MKQDGIRFLDELGDQFARIEATAPARQRRRPQFRVLAVTAAVLALAGGAVAAVVGTDDGPDTTGLIGADARVTVAEGTTRGGSDWLLSSGWKAPAGQFSARKNFCVSLRVTGPRGPEASVYCGPSVLPGRFSGGLAEDPGRDSGLVFGTVPDSVATVTVIETHSSTDYPTIDDEAGMPGRFYVADAGGDYRETRIVFRDENGRDLRAPVPINRYLRRVSVLD